MTKQKLINRPVAELTPYARNSRTHSKEQVAQIAASIQEFGFLNPVLVDAGGQIIAGHGRVLAAQQLGLAEVPCLLVEGLSEAQIRAYVIADNKLAENAGWDNNLLAGELAELRDGGFDLDLLGFSLDEMALLMSELPGEGLTDPDEVPDLPEEPASKLGDIWQLGDHRLMCGDSTDVYAVAALLGDGPAPHLMVTDPPYGVEYDASWRDGIRLSNGSGTAKGKVMNDNQADWRDAWALFQGDVVYVWHAGKFANVVADSLLACNFQIRAQIIWVKSQLVISRGHYHSQHEPCWHAVRKGKTGHWRGGRKQATVWREAISSLRPDERLFVRHDEGGALYALSGDESTVWEIPKPMKSETGHSTQKPVECMARPMRNNSAPGDAVYDPFSGSGTTLIAAEQYGRRCYAMELSPAYVDVGVRRWENFTGKKAVLCRPEGA